MVEETTSGVTQRKRPHRWINRGTPGTSSCLTDSSKEPGTSCCFIGSSVRTGNQLLDWFQGQNREPAAVLLVPGSEAGTS